MVSVYIETFGCCANQDNSAIIEGILLKNGFSISDEKNADIVIINSCTVKQKTEQKILSRIKQLKNRNLIVTGCMAGPQIDLIKKISPNISTVNTHNITQVPEVVRKLLNKEVVYLTARTKEIKVNLPKHQNKSYGITQIASGCKGSCTFCITRLEKGDLFSFPEKDILEDIKNNLKNSKRLIYLTSQDCAAYGLDTAKISKLPGLLSKIISIDKEFTLRIGMMNPEHVLPILKDLVQVYKNKKIMKFLHVPVQSGSNKILKEMNRNYTTEDFKKIVKEFRKEISAITISTDIIVGYPTETEEDFKKTLDLIKEIKPEVINISKFTPRPGTRAAKLKQLPTEVIKKRSVNTTSLYKKLILPKRVFS